MSSTRNELALGTVLDSIAAVAIVVASVLWADRNHVPLHGVASFLRVRLTLLNSSFLVVFAVLWCQCFIALDLFRRDGGFVRSMMLNAFGCAIMTATAGLYLAARHAEGPTLQILQSLFVASLTYELIRLLVRATSDGGYGHKVEKVIILGSGRRASKAWRDLRVEHHRTKRLLGFVDDRDTGLMSPDIAARYLGCIDDLPGYLRRHAVDELVIAAPLRSEYEMMQRGITVAAAAGVRVVCLSDIFSLSQQSQAGRRNGLFVELVPKLKTPIVSNRLKRALHAVGLP